MIVTLVQLLVFFGVPIVSIWACKRSKILNALSPVLLCYAAGIAFGNVVPLETMYEELATVEARPFAAHAHDAQPDPAPIGDAQATPHGDNAVNDTVAANSSDAPRKPGEFSPVEKTTNLVAGLGVILAIGMLMVSTDFVKWLRLARVTLMGAFLAMVSAVLVTTISAVALRAYSDELWQVAGMLVGVYTGGTINLASIARALNVDPVTWGVVHTSDMLVCGAYFLFLLMAGPKLFGLFLKPFKHPDRPAGEADTEEDAPPLKPLDFARSIGVGMLVIALPIGLSQVVPSSMEEPIAILGVTTMAIVLSFARPLREVRGLYVTGDYMLLVFCVAAGSLATLSRLYGADPFFFFYTALVVLSAVSLHAGLCWMFGIDRDTTIITSVAALFGPPFVPPVAAKLGNREIVVSGVTSGLVGLAAGNYLGLMVAYFVKWVAG